MNLYHAKEYGMVGRDVVACYDCAQDGDKYRSIIAAAQSTGTWTHWLDPIIAEQRANYKAAGVTDAMLASASDYSEADEVRDAAKKADKPITQLACACCGGVTRGRQWFNQDSGYGICGDCIAWLRKPKSDTGPARESEEYIRDCYGIEGKHFNVA